MYCRTIATAQMLRKDQPRLHGIMEKEKLDIQEAGSKHKGNPKLFLQTHLHLVDAWDGQENQHKVTNHIAEAVCILNIVALRVAHGLRIQPLLHVPRSRDGPTRKHS